MQDSHQQRRQSSLDEPLLLVVEQVDEASEQQLLRGPTQLPPRPPASPVKARPMSSTATTAWQELQLLLLLALPTIVTTAAQQVVIIVSQVFSGRISTDAAAAAALSNTVWNLLWYVVLGVSTALDTLGSQAVGAGDKRMLVVWTMAGALVITVITAPMSIILWHAGPLSEVFFGQGQDVSPLVSRFCRLLIPGLWPMSMAVLLQKYLQTQGRVGPPALASAASILVNLAGSWAGVLLLGFDGVAWAASGTRAFCLLAMLVAVAACESRDAARQQQEGERRSLWLRAATWRAGWCLLWQHAASLGTLCSFFALGAPGGIALGLEAAAFEASTAFAGFLGPVAVTAHAGIFSLTSLNYIALPFALATAATIRTGALLGASHGRVAAVSSRVVVGLGSSFMAVCGAAIYFGRHTLGLLFTAGDAEVLAAVALIAPLGALYQVGDGVLGTSQGVLRGLGRQAQLMMLNVVCFWLLAVPTGWWLTFRAGWGLPGLWAGMALGCFSAAGVSLVLMLCVDWQKEADRTATVLCTAAAADEPSPDTLPVAVAVVAAARDGDGCAWIAAA